MILLIILTEWLQENNLDAQFENKKPEDVAQLLKRFYGEVRKQDGTEYKHQSLISIRSCINRHLNSPPYNWNLDMVHSDIVKEANNVFQGHLKENKKEGLDDTKHKQALSNSDWEKLHTSNLLKGDTPDSLQNKVFVNLMTHFGRRGMEGLRLLKKNTFRVKVDGGQKYVERSYNEVSKNHPTSNSKDVNESESIMWAQPGDDRCPVQSFERYISYLHNDCDILFTYP